MTNFFNQNLLNVAGWPKLYKTSKSKGKTHNNRMTPKSSGFKEQKISNIVNKKVHWGLYLNQNEVYLRGKFLFVTRLRVLLLKDYLVASMTGVKIISNPSIWDSYNILPMIKMTNRNITQCGTQTTGLGFKIGNMREPAGILWMEK